MQTFYITLFLSYATISFGQVEYMGNWIKKHPSVIIVNSIDTNTDLINQLEKRNLQYIITNSGLTKEDIAIFEMNWSFSKNHDNTEEDERLKLWKAKHPTIQILSQSEFAKASEEKQFELIQNQTLITNKSEISLKDIEEYELTH